MDPISLIVAALVAGASVGLQETAGDALRDGYQGLKTLILRRFKGDSGAEAQVEAVERTPDADTTALRERLQQANAGADAELIQAARELLERVDPDGARVGKYQVTVSGGKVGAIGDHANVTMN